DRSALRAGESVAPAYGRDRVRFRSARRNQPADHRGHLRRNTALRAGAVCAGAARSPLRRRSRAFRAGESGRSGEAGPDRPRAATSRRRRAASRDRGLAPSMILFALFAIALCGAGAVAMGFPDRAGDRVDRALRICIGAALGFGTWSVAYAASRMAGISAMAKDLVL